MDIDQLLDRSTPATASRTPDLQRDLQRLVRSAEDQQRPRRRALRAGILGGVATALVGAGAAGAMATGLVPTPAWVPWSTAAGSSCQMEFTVRAAGSDGEPAKQVYSAEQTQQSLRAARDFLATVDYASIDEAAAIRAWRTDEASARAGEAPDERQPRLTGDDLEITAVGAVVWHRLDAHLAEEGIPSGPLLFGQGWRCRS